MPHADLKRVLGSSIDTKEEGRFKHYRRNVDLQESTFVELYCTRYHG